MQDLSEQAIHKIQQENKKLKEILTQKDKELDIKHRL